MAQSFVFGEPLPKRSHRNPRFPEAIRLFLGSDRRSQEAAKDSLDADLVGGQRQRLQL
jgi:hypothetical protein